MGSITPIYKLPYPLGTDRVMDGDDAIKALAQGVEGMVKGGYAVVNTNATGDANITFPVPYPTGLIAAVLTEAAEQGGAGPVHLKWTKATSDRTWITFRAYQSNGAALSNFTVPLGWVALGY